MEYNSRPVEFNLSEETAAKLNAPVPFEEPQTLYERVIKELHEHRPTDDLGIVERAYALAASSHGSQQRKSGEPYIIHPLCVALILIDLEMDTESVAAGILHDVVEDTQVSLDDIREQFGDDIAGLVDGVTKLTQIKYTADKVEVQAENLRKMFLAMANDIRVIIIKLADRLHNMETLQYMSRAKQIEKSKETMEIYAPIAGRLGIGKLKIPLENLGFKYLLPEKYFALEEGLEERRGVTDGFINLMVENVRDDMQKNEISCSVEGRVKHMYSIYKKMVVQGKSLDQIYDLFAVRILVENVKDCYAALGILHELYKPIPGRFKDYIAVPKANMYQSLHTTLISSNGTPFEVQIRTYEMHQTAEYGVAAHWKYKEGVRINKSLKPGEEEKLNWLKQLIDMQHETSDNHEFLDSIKNDLDIYADDVFCFTPDGDVINLPSGSTPIDFAYSIHTAVGNKMIGARVNDRIVNIDYQLQNGDRVEIITSQNSKGPSLDWLNIVKSGSARTKINQWFRNANKDDNIKRGRELIEKYCQDKGIKDPIFTPDLQEVAVAKYSCRDWDGVLAAIGHGGLKEGQVVNRLYEEYNKIHKKTEMTDDDVIKSAKESYRKEGSSNRANGIVVRGIHDVAVHFAKCCSPLPGDDIVGFVTRGRGVTVHRTDCINIVNLTPLERERLIEAQWDKPQSAFTEERYKAEITVFADNRVGLLVDISRIMSERGLDVTSMNVRVSKQQLATIDLGFDISSRSELEKVIEKLGQIQGIQDIIRTRG